jgi:hypothetical protein
VEGGDGRKVPLGAGADLGRNDALEPGIEGDLLGGEAQ